MTPKGIRPTQAEIDLDNLAFNFRSAKAFIGPEIGYMGVVKANAYGHGAVECSRRLAAENIDVLAVAIPEEGIELRRAGIETPIVCLGGFWEGQEDLLIDHRLMPVVFRIEQAASLEKVARSRSVEPRIHVKIDTGMGRIGVRYDEVENFAMALKSFPRLRLEGLMTHFAAADDPGQNEFTALQIERFDSVLNVFSELGFNPAYVDLANSPAAVAHPETRRGIVRLGGLLYGLGDDVLPLASEKPEFRPVMSVRTKIAHLKPVRKGETLGYGRTFTARSDMLAATVPIGYYDGYTRRLSNSGRMIVNGQIVPVAGRVSMDWTILDVSKVENVKVGDDVTVFGKSGELEIRASELARLTDTISYEITCAVSGRVPRVYL